jgi:hypothetical protein
VAKVEVKLDKAEVGNLLKSPEVYKFLEDLGNQVAANGDGLQVQKGSRSSRAVVNVIDPSEGARFREAQTGNLARALGSV